MPWNAFVETRSLPGKGRGVFATRLIHSGEVVVFDKPLVLCPQEGFRSGVCSYCLRALSLAGTACTSCPSCQQANFCSQPCAQAAASDPASHSRLVCRCLTTCNLAGLSEDQQSSLHFLFRVASLKQAALLGDAASAARLAAVASLSGGATTCTLECQELHGRLVHACAAAGVPNPEGLLSLQEVGDFLQKDLINGYGIMAPSGPEGERQIRGGGLYPIASLINHDCLPNLARFDNFDAASAAEQAPGSNTAIELRALHAIPQGEELTQSYFPLTWDYKERQERCQEQYGFQCTCPRCQEESLWADDDDDSDEWMTDDEEHDPGAHAADEAVTQAEHKQHCGSSGTPQQPECEDPKADTAYIHLFLLKYVCTQEDCQGTLAPVQGTDRYECNMCGLTRTEGDFLAEVQNGS